MYMPKEHVYIHVLILSRVNSKILTNEVLQSHK